MEIVTNVDEVFESTTTKEPIYHEYPVPFAETVGTTIIIVFIIFAAISGNVFVITSVFTYQPLRTVQNMFIVSLAVTDITVAILIMPLKVAYILMKKWKFGLHICKMWLSLDVLCCTASIFHLCAIALDRYWAIHDPINYANKRTIKRVLIIIIGVWTFSMVICAPPLIGWNDWPQNFTDETPCLLTAERGYVIYSASGSFYIPLIVMTVVYFKIYQAVRRRLRKKDFNSANLVGIASIKSPIALSSIDLTSTQSERSMSADTKQSESSTRYQKESDERDECVSSNNQVSTDVAGHPTTNFANITPENVNDNIAGNKPKGKIELWSENPHLTVSILHSMNQKNKINLKKERRAAKVLGIVMGVFVGCWLPFFLMYIIMAFCETCYVSQRMDDMIRWMGYSNSALNPIIYTVFNVQFRKAFIYLLCRKPSGRNR